jgi:hypothetical protein
MNFDQFVTLLINSRIINEPEAMKVAAAFRAGCREFDKADTREFFCDFLISTKRVTEWQCNKLRIGKWKGFHLDDYLILELVGKDNCSSSYKARDTSDGKFVCLVVTPPALAKRGGIEYRVEPYAE